MSATSTFREVQAYIENPSDYTHYFKGFTLYTTALDTPSLRNILTTVFVLLNFSIVLVGSSFLKQRNLLRLRINSRPVAINHLTSWMTIKSSFMYVLHTYRLPGGSVGFSLMLLTGVFGLVDQYFVNSFILPEAMQGRCTFESGIVTTVFQSVTVPSPVSTFASARTAINAQYFGVSNGGQFGIYDKVNINLTRFKPTTEDVIGWWNCTYEPSTIITATYWKDLTSLESYVSQQGFLFTEASYSSNVVWASDNSVQGFLMWSADQPEDAEQKSPQQWNVRASVATNLSSSPAESISTAIMTNLECKLTSKDGSNWIPPILPSQSSLTNWGDITFGLLMTSPSYYYGLYIEWMLNAMVMVGGSGNNDQWTPAGLGTLESLKYGCGVRGSKIAPQIWAILIVMFVIFALLILADVMLRLYQRFQREDIAGGDLAKETPSGVEYWQLLLLQELMQDRTIKLSDMRDYEYKWDKDNKYEIRKRGSPARATPSIDPAPATYRSYSQISREISL